MGGTEGTNGRVEKIAYVFWWECPKKETAWKTRAYDVRMGSKWVLGCLAGRV